MIEESDFCKQNRASKQVWGTAENKNKDKHQKICDGGIYQHWRLHSHLFGTKYALACNFITKNKKK